jgi:glycosyltransferase involved in cell wall biosynthesis
MRPKTVLMLLTNAYDPDPRVRQEALALLAMGCRVRMLAWDRDMQAPAFQNMEGVEVERVFLRSKHGRGATQIFFYGWLYLKMLWLGMRRSFDAVHCHDLDTLPIGFILGKLKRKPIVYDAHESFPDMLEGSVPRAVQRGLVRLEDFLIRRIDLLITVGEKLRRRFVEKGVRRSVVVGNWKRTDDFSRSEAQNLTLRKRLGVPVDALLVVCITQLLRDRKLKELLDGASRCPNVYVIIGGKGVLQPLVEQAAVENPRIRFVGFISGTQIEDYTCAADVIFYGFDPENPNAQYSAPNKLFEALAAGRPLVTGDFGEIAEVVRESECGIVLSKYGGEEISHAFRTLENPVTRDRMASNSRQRGRGEMNWEKAEERLYTEYSRLLPASSLRPPVTLAQALNRPQPQAEVR